MGKVGSILAALLLAISVGCADASAQEKPYSILVDKGAFELYLLDAKGDTLMHYPVATGINIGKKRRAGDNKTPEGDFTVEWVQNTKGVMYDYHDGKGKVEAYGPYFIHLITGFKAIGIHGTCPERDDRIGTRDSKGCIRLHNEDLLKLLPYVEKKMKGKVIPGPEDIAADKRIDGNK